MNAVSHAGTLLLQAGPAQVSGGQVQLIQCEFGRTYSQLRCESVQHYGVVGPMKN